MFVSYLYIIVYGGAFIGLCHWKFTNMMSYKLVFGLVVALYCIWCEQHRRCHSGHVSKLTNSCCTHFFPGTLWGKSSSGLRALAYVPACPLASPIR